MQFKWERKGGGERERGVGFDSYILNIYQKSVYL